MVIGGKLAMAKREDNRFVHVFQCIKDVKAYLGLASLSIERDQTFCALGLLRQQLNGHVAEQAFEIDLGKIETEAMQSIELKVGQSSIKIDQMGVTIKGMMIKVEAQVQGQFKATMTQVSGSAMTTVKGGVVMIN